MNPTDETMELIACLYSCMDEEDYAGWSIQEAQNMVKDQYRYEIEHELTPGRYDPVAFYEIIAEFIRQDTAL